MSSVLGHLFSLFDSVMISHTTYRENIRRIRRNEDIKTVGVLYYCFYLLLFVSSILVLSNIIYINELFFQHFGVISLLGSGLGIKLCD